MSALGEKKRRSLQSVVRGRFVVAAALSASVFACDFTRTAITQSSVAQEIAKSENGAETVARPLLTMERIFASGEFGERGVDAKWAPTGAAFVRRVASSEPCGGRDVVLVSPSDGTSTPIVKASELIPRDAESNKPIEGAKPLNVEDYALSDDANLVLIYTNSKRVWRRNTRGDYWILDRKNDVLRKLGGDFAAPSTLQFAKISPDGTRVGYVCKNDIYVEEILTGKIRRVTFDGSADIINGTFDWVYEEEFDCRDGFRWSPDGEKIAFWRLDSSREPAFVMLDGVGLSGVSGAARVVQVDGDFRTLDDDAAKPAQNVGDAASKNSKEENAQKILKERLASYPTMVSFKYPRVGCENAIAQIGIATLPELGDETSEIPLKFVDFKDENEFYLPRMEWFKGRPGPIVQKTPRSQRRCDFYAVDAETAEATLLFSDADPNGAWQTVYDVKPLSDGERFLVASERDGFRRFYVGAFSDAASLKPITPAGSDAIDFVAFDYDANGVETGVYFYASPENATRRFLYRSAFDGSTERVVLTESDAASESANVPTANDFGFETWNVSADSRWAILRRSAFGVPSRIDLVKLESGKAQVVKTLEDNAELRERLAKENLGAFEFVSLEIDGKIDVEFPYDKKTQNGAQTDAKVQIDGWVILPPDWNPNDAKRYPVLVYVYGEPAGQTVVDSWGGSTYMYHQALAQRGCVVVSFDNRGTPAPKGREWRKCVYQRFGAVGRSDQAAALRQFAATWSGASKLDLSRVGVWGWSGGGTSTLNLLFNYPDLYTCGVSIAPVPDYRNYDTIYQERYSGLITETPESYELGSPIGFASGLKGKLLLIHGSGDDNCHYQTSERLIDALIAAGKEFDAFAYPFRSHGIYEGRGTSLHLRKKTFEFWSRHLFDDGENSAK